MLFEGRNCDICGSVSDGLTLYIEYFVLVQCMRLCLDRFDAAATSQHLSAYDLS